MGRGLLVLVFTILPFAAFSADTYRVPIAVIPGTVSFQGFGDYSPIADPVSVALPVSRQVIANSSGSSCSAGLVTVDIDVVDGGLEAQLSGYAAGAGCSLGGHILFEGEIQAPELGGTATSVRLVPEVIQFQFIDYASVDAELNTLDSTTSSHPDMEFSAIGSSVLLWDGTADPNNPPTTPRRQSIRVLDWIPGDTIRFRGLVRISIRANAGNPAQGTVRTRWEYRVTVPEPSASLSLPIGAGALVAFAMMRGAA